MTAFFSPSELFPVQMEGVKLTVNKGLSNHFQVSLSCAIILQRSSQPSLCICTSSPLVKVKSLSHVRLFAIPWTVAYQASQSMGFSRQECWSGLPFPSPGDLLDPGIKPGSPALQAGALPSEPPGKPLLFNFSLVPSKCIHVVAHGRIPFFFYG